MNFVRGRLGAAIMFALLGLVTLVAPAAAQDENGTLVIYAYACPGGIPSSNFSACHEQPLGGVGFTAFEAGQDNGVGATTTADGDASISLGAIGGGTVNVFVTPPAGYQTGFISCSQEYGAVDGGISLPNVPKDGFVTCQWYFVATGGDPDPTAPPAAEPTQPPVTGMPTTGSGSLVAAGHDWLPALLGVLVMIILHLAHAAFRRRRARQ